MKKEDIVPTAKVKHKVHNVTETIVSRCMMKDPQSGTWYDGVIYAGKERQTGLQTIFVREIDSFCNSFELVEETTKANPILDTSEIDRFIDDVKDSGNMMYDKRDVMLLLEKLKQNIRL